jgi:hypothetical protein
VTPSPSRRVGWEAIRPSPTNSLPQRPRQRLFQNLPRSCCSVQASPRASPAGAAGSSRAAGPGTAGQRPRERHLAGNRQRDRQGFQVLARCKEEGESAKTTDRTELERLLKYCQANKGRVHFLVVFNLTRFAREKYDHFALRAPSQVARHFISRRDISPNEKSWQTSRPLGYAAGPAISSRCLMKQPFTGCKRSERTHLNHFPARTERAGLPLRAFVRCEACGRGLTASWSNGTERVLYLLSRRGGTQVPGGQHHEDAARRAVRGGTGTAPADRWLHAATEGHRP